MVLEAALFQALKAVEFLDLPPGIPSSGKRFEDHTFTELYRVVRKQAGVDAYPPRYTLRQATHSGVAHQFDIVVRGKQLAAIECKFRKRTGIDALFAFVGKLIDYEKPPQGFFVTTAENLNNDVLCYGIAHHVSIVCSSLAPVEYMMQRVKPNTDLARRLAGLHERLQTESVPRHILVQWQNEYRRFVAEGYC